VLAILALLSINHVLWASSNHEGPAIVFDNFDQSIELVEKGNVYRLEGRDFSVKLSDRLLVKVSNKVSKAAVESMQQNIQSVVPVFNGLDFTYFNVKLDDSLLLGQSLRQLRANKNVLLVQPDLLQISDAKFTANTAVSAVKQVRSDSWAEYKRGIKLASIQKYTLGQGIRIAVIDSGFLLEHESLAHIRPIFSYDVHTQSVATMSSIANANHGTRVAGIIFGKATAEFSGGVAPEAQMIALSHVDTWTSKTILTFQLAQLERADVVNCSWNSVWLTEPVADVINELTKNGRGGRGVAVVIAAGNGGKDVTSSPTEAFLDNAIVVGAHDLNHNRLPYSNYGQSVDFSSFGSATIVPDSNGGYGKFGGTSMAAAVASGIAALKLSLNPELTVRQLASELNAVFQLNTMERRDS